MALDKNCKEIPYLLGRLGAIISRVVKLSPAQYGQAQMQPFVAFPKMLTRYYSSGNPESEEEVREIMSNFSSDFEYPKQLNMAEQGQFIIGWHHQLAEISKEQNRSKIAKAIKLKRVELDMTQSQLAEKAGVTRQSIASIESGDYNASIDVLSAVMAVLSINMTIE